MRFLLGLTLAAAACANVYGWGCEGHQAIALIAAHHLTPQTRAAVYGILNDNPIDPSLSRFCRPLAADAMADAATWADDMKKSAGNDVWHFVDLPRDMQHGDIMAYCQPAGDSPGCILTAITRQMAILKDSSAAPPKRADALRYLIHLIGDLHQPLHTTDDVGGNCISVLLFDNPKPGNLHAAWDYGIIEHYLKHNQQTPAQLAANLDRQYRLKGRTWLEQPADIPEWIWETHHLAAPVTYGKLVPKPSFPPVDQFGPACDAEKEKTAALHIHVAAKYSAEVMPVIERQLAKAGYRLAAVLNSLLPNR